MKERKRKIKKMIEKRMKERKRKMKEAKTEKK